MWASIWTTSAIRRSRSVWAACLTATAAAFSQDSELVPTSSITSYTLSGMASSLLGQMRKGWGSMIEDPDAEVPIAPQPPGANHSVVLRGVPSPDPSTARTEDRTARPAAPGPCPAHPTSGRPAGRPLTGEFRPHHNTPRGPHPEPGGLPEVATPPSETLPHRADARRRSRAGIIGNN